MIDKKDDFKEWLISLSGVISERQIHYGCFWPAWGFAFVAVELGPNRI